MSLFSRIRFFGLFALLFALLGIQRCTAPPAAAPTSDGYRPADQAPAPVAVPAPAVRLVNSRRLLDELADTASRAEPNLGRKALPRSRWHQAPCSSACAFCLLPRTVYLDEAAKLHKI